jgi:hypothetical protein
MVFGGVVEKAGTDATGCGWVDVAVTLTVNEKTMTECSTRIAVPVQPGDNPWKRHAEAWRP